MKTTVPAPMPRFALLVKAVGDFKHSGKYALINGRWHLIGGDKPAPKGAPVAAHKHAAGQFVPKKHYTDEQWAQLKLPDSNTNAASHNKKIEQIKELSESGNVTGLLGLQIGSNTYGKVHAKLINDHLEQYGVEHKVTPGQAAGSHPAVQQAPDQAPNISAQAPNTSVEAPNISAPEAAAPTAPDAAKHKLGPVSQALKEAVSKPEQAGLAMPAFVEGKTTNGVVDYYQKVAKKIIDLAAAGDASGLEMMPTDKGNTWAGKTENSKLLLELYAQAKAHAGKSPSAALFEKAVSLLGKYNSPIEFLNSEEWDAIEEARNALTPLEMNKFNVAWQKHIFNAQKNPPADKSTHSVSAEPEPAPAAQADEVSNQQQTADNLADKPANQQNNATSKLSQIPWDSQLLPDSNTNSGSHNKQVQKIKALADAGDVAGLEALKFGVNTYGKKQEKLKQLAIAALKEDAAAPAPASQPEPIPEPASAAPAEEGPKEGDTKPGADGGTLVFSKGRWHKQEQAKTAEPAAEPGAEAQHPIDAVPMPELTFSSPSSNAKVAAALEKLKEQIKAEGPSALKGVTKHMKAKGKYIVSLPGMYGKLKVYGYEHAPDHAGSKVHAYVEALKAAAGKPSKKPKAAPVTTGAPHAEQNAIEAMDGWQQTGPQGGSNPGGKFKDENGVDWYCKFPGNEDVAKSEVLAAKLYQALGIAGQDAKLVTKGGKLGIASRWQDVKKATSPAELAKVDGVASGFAADAWLGNWDVVGLGYDNLQIDAATGKAMRVDAGGSLQYRAQGGKKDFGSVVTEIDSLRDPKINPQAAAVFGKLSQADITAGVAKVLKISDAQIHALVNTYGPGDAAHKKALAETLIARKADLLAKFPKAKKDKKLTFKPEKISEPPSFLNWGGSGKDGPSSKPFLNKANEEAVQAIYAAAKTGSIEAIQKLEANVYDKNTGAVTGSAPVLSHPSQHVKGYAQQAINEINYQLNPPKRFRFEGGHPLATLNSAYPAHKGPPHSAAVEQAGKFLVLGEPGKISLESLALPKTTYASGALTRATYSPQAKAAISKMPETQKQAIKQYTGSSYVGMNTSLWGGNPSGAAKAAAEALHTNSHDITPGTVLSRKLTVQGPGLDQILKSTGKVLQEPAIMSTSIRPSSWSGNVHLKLHVGPGVKGLWVGVGSTGPGSALSVNSSEDELILPPNTRIMVLSVKPSKGGDADGFGTGSSHIVEAIVLPTQSPA
jgi:hypothetical protein